MSLSMAEISWHSGEEEVQKLLRVPSMDNPTQPYLSPHASNILVRSPLMALGTLDAEGRPWTTLWGGETGFSRPIANSIIGVRATVDRTYDPVAERLFEGQSDGEVIQAKGVGKMVSALGIDLQARRRVKLYGRMVAGALAGTEEGIGDAQLVVRIEQSLGNCPKYLNKKRIVPHLPHPKLLSSSLPLPPQAIDLISKSDLFFMSSSNHESDMDTNHRGGPPGFVRSIMDNDGGLTLVYPEYSGNRLYQSLGNLRNTPKAGLAFPDFTTGDILYVTGTTEILIGKDATDLIGHTNLAVKIKVDAARFVSDGLAFRGHEGEYSPYNPPVRYLSTEKKAGVSGDGQEIRAKLIDKTILTPTVARFRFHIADPKKASQWKPGQYVALAFNEELDIGYSHMRDDDPRSLNDDFLRTFTVSSRQGGKTSAEHDQFEITIRKVGVATDFLFRHNPRATLELPIQGFGGEFYITQAPDENVAFVAAGVGITPLLAQAKDLDLNRFHLYWTVRAEDIALVNDTFEKIADLAEHSSVFVTGNIDESSPEWTELDKSPAKLQKRRVSKEDLSADSSSKWYLCTGTGMRSSLVEWLYDKTVVYEDFNY